MKKFLPLILIAAIVVVSGCTGGEVSDKTNGMIIKSFIADPNEVEGTETVYFTFEIENVGGAIANEVKASLIGLPTGDIGWTEATEIHLGELMPPQAGIQGDIASDGWDLVAPVSETDMKYPAELLVEYEYATHSENLVRVATRTWIKSLKVDQQDAEMDKLGEISRSQQLGPLHVNIKVRKGAIYTTQDEFRVILEIQNVGDGRPFLDARGDDTITISFQGLNRCKDGASEFSGERNIKLIQGESKQLRCYADLTGVTDWQNLRIDIDLDYKYTIRSPVEVTVLGTPEGW